MFSFYAYPILMFRACLSVTLHCGLGVGIRTQHRSGKGHVDSVGLNCNRYIMFGVWGYCFVSVGSAPLSSYCHSEPAFCNAVFMAATAVCQVTSVPSTL